MLALCEGNPKVDSPLKGTVTRKVFPCDDVIMCMIVGNKTYHLVAIIVAIIVVPYLQVKSL